MNELATIGSVFDGVSGEELVRKLFIIEQGTKDLPQLEVPTEHFFANGVYARQITIPKGAFIIGKMHRFAQINTVSQGDISVLTDSGMVRMKAPFTFSSSAGTKRAGYAHEETVWITYVRTDSTDIDEIEEEIIIPSYEQFLLEKETTLKLEGE